MATIKSHGTEVITHTTKNGSKYRLMSDGFMLVNYGGGWRVWTRTPGSIRGKDASAEKLQSAADWLYQRCLEINKESCRMNLVYGDGYGTRPGEGGVADYQSGDEPMKREE
jgi:hypothetical protein